MTTIPTVPLVFLDTETTGVHWGREAWEVGMIRREPNGTQRELQFYVDVDLANADPFGLTIGRFYERHPVGRTLASDTAISPRPGAVWSKARAATAVAQWTHGAHIVGAVPNFDTEVLGTLLRQFSLIPAWHYHLIDVENLAVGFLSGRDVILSPPWTSDEISNTLGIPTVSAEDRHTALGDARWAMAIYDKVMGSSPPSESAVSPIPEGINP